RGLYKIRAIVVHVENRKATVGGVGEEVRPNAVKAVGTPKEGGDLQKAIDGLLMGDETALGSDDGGHDAEAARSQRDHVVVAGATLVGHAGMRPGFFPVIAKRRLLHHREQFVIRHWMRR